MSNWPDVDEGKYALRSDEFFGLGTVACRRCGAMVALPMPDGPLPTSIERHDMFHERFDEMWWAHYNREEAKLDE